MKKVILTACILTLGFAGVFGQVTKMLQLKIKNSKQDTSKIKWQLELADYYLNYVDQLPNQIDSAQDLANKAFLLARSLGNTNWEFKALRRIGEANYQKKDTINGLDCLMRVRKYYQKKGDYLNEARAWNREGIVYTSPGKIAMAYRINCYDHALAIFKRIGNNLEMAEVIQNKAKIHIGNADFKLAEDELLQVLALYKKSGYKKLDYTYSLLADIRSLDGNINKELFYLLEAIKNVQATGDTAKISTYYKRVSSVYTLIGKREEGLVWLRKAIAANRSYDVYMYTEMINDLTALKRPKEALDTINALTKRPPPASPAAQQSFYKSLGFCYSRLNENARAEEYYLKMMAVDLSELKHQNVYVYLNYYLSSNDAISFFYIRNNQHEKAREYLNNMLAIYKSPPAAIHPVFKINTYLGMYNIEYAAHHYREAIDYFNLHKNLYDSVFNADKNRQLEEFKIKYETGKKEQAIRTLQIREQQAILQNNLKQAELQKEGLQRDVQIAELKQGALLKSVQQAKLQKVTLLQKTELQKANFQRNIQAAEIQKINMQRNITIAGIAMVLIIAGLAYNGYRHKQRSNIEISNQNKALQNLLIEKDWLLKEVHHRVKNNLQIVMSLLNSQSAYLENNAALEAIRESQGRVQAISLIHQKLYTGSNVASINMQSYVIELINYLTDSFDTRRRHVIIEQIVEPFTLDIAQAVPLGLILNESITNAIKYAFNEHGGHIVIAAQLIGNENLLVTIVDNGCGLPPDFDLKTAASLGMEMMKALSTQLGGEFEIRNNSGVNISIEFQITPVLNSFGTEGINASIA